MRKTETRTRELRARPDFDPNVGGRNCDRSVEGSPLLEGFDELRGLTVVYSFQREVEMHRVEESEVGSHRPRAVHGPRNLHADAPQRHGFLSCDDLQKLHTASGNSGEKELRGSHRFARTSVLDRAIDDEMVLAAAAEN